MPPYASPKSLTPVNCRKNGDWHRPVWDDLVWQTTDCGKGLEILIYKHILIYMNEPSSLRKGTLLLSALAVLAGFAPASFSLAADAAPASVVVQAGEVDLAFPVEATVEAVRQATVAAQVAGRVLDVRVDAGPAREAGRTPDAHRCPRGRRFGCRAEGHAGTGALPPMSGPKTCMRRSSSARPRWTRRAAYKAAEGAASSPAPGFARHVTAPIAGIVAQRHVEAGEMATPGKPLITIFDPEGPARDRQPAAVQAGRTEEIAARAHRVPEADAGSRCSASKSCPRSTPAATRRRHASTCRKTSRAWYPASMPARISRSGRRGSSPCRRPPSCAVAK
jgi:hypothetical protein